jgi:hypothetical protein
MQPLEQHGPAVRLGTQEAHGSVAGPSPQGKVLVLGLDIGECNLEHRRNAGRGAHG